MWAWVISFSLLASAFLTQEEALKLVFPQAKWERETLYLTPEEQKILCQQWAEARPSHLVFRYKAYQEGKLVGYAYFDKHIVRTLPEVLMVALDHQGKVKRVEVLKFREPPDYLPNRKWYDQFEGKTLKDPLILGEDIRGVLGATLTARTTTRKVKEILTLHELLSRREKR